MTFREPCVSYWCTQSTCGPISPFGGWLQCIELLKGILLKVSSPTADCVTTWTGITLEQGGNVSALLLARGCLCGGSHYWSHRSHCNHTPCGRALHWPTTSAPAPNIARATASQSSTSDCCCVRGSVAVNAQSKGCEGDDARREQLKEAQ